MSGDTSNRITSSEFHDELDRQIARQFYRISTTSRN